MSAENVDIVRRAFLDTDFESYFALASEQIEVYVGIRVEEAVEAMSA
jgi:hypothetical protein